MKLRCAFFVLCLSALAAGGEAGEADVAGVKITPNASGGYRFDVTVRHDDSGWDHYANRWEVRRSDGEIIATRVLHHPHVDEQPFTRSLPEVTIPSGVDRVTVRAHCSVHGYGGEKKTVSVPLQPAR